MVHCVLFSLYIPCYAGIDYVFHCVLFNLYMPCDAGIDWWCQNTIQRGLSQRREQWG